MVQIWHNNDATHLGTHRIVHVPFMKSGFSRTNNAVALFWVHGVWFVLTKLSWDWLTFQIVCVFLSLFHHSVMDYRNIQTIRLIGRISRFKGDIEAKITFSEFIIFTSRSDIHEKVNNVLKTIIFDVAGVEHHLPKRRYICIHFLEIWNQLNQWAEQKNYMWKTSKNRKVFFQTTFPKKTLFISVKRMNRSSSNSHNLFSYLKVMNKNEIWKKYSHFSICRIT